MGPFGGTQFPGKRCFHWKSVSDILSTRMFGTSVKILFSNKECEINEDCRKARTIRNYIQTLRTNEPDNLETHSMATARPLSSIGGESDGRSSIDDEDLQKEQVIIDIFFKRLDTAKSIVCHWPNLGFFIFVYIYTLFSAIAAIYVDAHAPIANSSYQRSTTANILVVVLIVLQSISCISSVILLKSILENSNICNSYVEYNICDQMSRFPEQSPIIALYFKGTLLFHSCNLLEPWHSSTCEKCHFLIE